MRPIIDLKLLKKYSPSTHEEDPERFRFKVGTVLIEVFNFHIPYKGAEPKAEFVFHKGRNVIDRTTLKFMTAKDRNSVLKSSRLTDEGKKAVESFLFDFCHAYNRAKVSVVKPRLPTWSQLGRMKEAEPQWIVKPICGIGDVVLISGPGKSGKTILVSEACISLATGQPWLGMFEVSDYPLPSLYLDFEMGRRH
jgi:hypothetical protein